ncbi:MAG: riboflavin synthase [Acidimicrobiia bacterium]|nr:riboflavin synthase [Acidimicrobiia bacterium]NNF88857.1 riboflavin synthase [Acidimicrobiia bacterium]NNL13966.1 riboflavin synthase [Acidimicrobiia bacterium]NNL68865.1 riboflavin synthase [Acidimicrobiia bacterium]RZV46651.1 MAG: riboflavin synthase [Acidimicrobiia bacterium]
MFTGIVEGMGQIGDVVPADGQRDFTIIADKVLEGMEVGDSIAVNGVCLTAVAVGDDQVRVTAVTETLDRTNLGRLAPGDRVDLERPMPAAGRFDGHIVQGHVDGTATVAGIEPEAESIRMRFVAEPALLRYVVEKGSVTVDGVSLTVTAAQSDSFELVLIPHTLDVTVLGLREVGDVVNVEVDILAKYVERLLEVRQ